MRLPEKTIRRGLALLALAVLVFGLAAPYLSVNRLARRIQGSLEAALGRKVELGGVHLNLFEGPGFYLSRVVIHEDPQIGLEPLAYIDSLEARVRFRSLWSGKLEFSTLRLNQPSINLAKPAAGGWNFERLLSRTVGAAARPAPRLPNLQVRGGRINFKLGDLKSVYYLTDPEVDITPPSAQDGYWRLRFSGEPARTDRPARGFGRFVARGRWQPDPRTGGQVDLTLELENTPLAELVTLLHGHDVGVHGQISARARLAGPASAIQISGQVQFQDIHRWDLLPPHGGDWLLDCRGRLDLAGQRLELESVTAGEAPAPLTIRLRVVDYLSQPRWGALATLGGLPVAPLVEVARHMGVGLDKELSAEGALTGAVGYSSEAGLQGILACPEAAVKAPGRAAFRVQRAEMLLDWPRVRLLPTLVRTARDEQATLLAEYSHASETLELSLQTPSMRIADLHSTLAGLLAPVPLLEHCQEGHWQGRLSCRTRLAQKPEWSGTFEITGARMDLAGATAPLEIRRARAVLRDGEAVLDRIQARLGTVELQGQYRWAPKAARPHQVQLLIPQITAAEAESLLMPTLRRREGLLARTLGLGRTKIPPWLAERQAEGGIELGMLALGDLRLDSVRARWRWNGADVEAQPLEARLADGLLSGRLTVDLGRSAPAYRLTAKLRGAAFSGGLWEAEGALESQGTGLELWRNLRAQGSFHAREPDLGAEDKFDSVSGSFEMSVTRGGPRLRLTSLEAALGEELFEGQAASQDDGRVHLELSDGRRQLRALISLSPFQLVWQPPSGSK